MYPELGGSKNVHPEDQFGKHCPETFVNYKGLIHTIKHLLRNCPNTVIILFRYANISVIGSSSSEIRFHSTFCCKLSVHLPPLY